MKNMENKTGTITVDGKEATVTFERHLSHPVEKVWEAITEADKRAKWFGPTEIDPREGGVMITTAKGPPAPEGVRRTEAEILIWDPPHIFEYKEKSENLGETIIRFELEAKDETTILRVINSGLSAGDAYGYAPGWHAFLDRLEAQLHRKNLPVWIERYEKVQEAYKE